MRTYTHIIAHPNLSSVLVNVHEDDPNIASLIADGWSWDEILDIVMPVGDYYDLEPGAYVLSHDADGDYIPGSNFRWRFTGDKLIYIGD